jgi:MATE family multidrug resistance protein
MTSLPNPGWNNGQSSFRGAASLSSSPIAQYSIARDISEDTDSEGSGSGSGSEEDSDTSTIRPRSSADGSSAQRSRSHVALSYRRPSFVATGNRPTVLLTGGNNERRKLNKAEREALKKDERSLLRDNHLIPPKDNQSQGPIDALRRKISRAGLERLSSGASHQSGTSHNGGSRRASETTALLDGEPVDDGQQDQSIDVRQRWEEAVISGKIQTTWQREAKTLVRYSRSLIVTFLLQYSLTVASIFTVGHLGTAELGAVSLASMSANITGYAIYQGLATSLDTLCSQAYGSGKKKLVGLQLQRMVYFLWIITIPIGLVWIAAPRILMKIVPDPLIGALAGRYLQIILAGAPGYALFESGKRYVQAQGNFHATLYVLMICAPLNAFMNWFFVWHLRMGFIGAPIAVAITDNLLPLFLFLYVRFIDGMECWGGFSKRALHNWWPMIKLALPGLVMVLAEFFAFEVLTLVSSYFGAEVLAAQSVLSTITSITFYIPFPVSVAASTRIANLIGATLSDAARITAKVAICMAAFLGLFNAVMLLALRKLIARLFTNDEVVIELVANVLPLCAAFQLFDALAANCGGVLRGLGRQEVGGYVNLVCYYAVSHSFPHS